MGCEYHRSQVNTIHSQVLATTPSQKQMRVTEEGGISKSSSPGRALLAEVMSGRIAMMLPSRA